MAHAAPDSPVDAPAEAASRPDPSLRARFRGSAAAALPFVCVGSAASAGELSAIVTSGPEAYAIPGVLGGALLALALLALWRSRRRIERARALLAADAAEIDDLYANAPVGYHSLDGDGRFLRINDTELAWLGRRREDVIGRHFTEFCTPAAVGTFRRHFPDFRRTGELHDVEFDLVRADGTILPVMIRATAVREADGRFRMSRSAVLDLSERRSLERDLDRLYLLSRDLFAIGDSAGRFIRMNPAWTNVLGWTEDELIGRSFLELVHPDDHARTVAAFEHHVRSGDAVLSFENRYRSKDGAWRALLWSSVLVQDEGLIYAVAHDITETKKAEQMFRGVLESAPDAMVVVTSDGSILLVNEQTEKLFGYGRDELLGQPVEMLVPDRFRERHPAHRMRYFAGPEARPMGSGLELSALRSDGREFPIELSLGPVHTPNGTLAAAAIRDISERKREERELRVAKAATEAANKELEAFSYSVSHDLRAPLRAIDGFSRILEEEYTEKLDDEAKRIVGVLRSNTDRMGRLIDDLLDFSRLGRSELAASHVDMTALVREVLAEVVAQSGGRPESVVLPLARAWGDATLLRQVWINLLSNAIKFSAHATPPRIEVGARDESEETIYWVRDNGAGFDMRYVGKLFGVFQRLHSQTEFPGTGVGLAIVQRIVARHGGRVWAEGTPGAGATFHFSLPRGAHTT